VQQDALIAVTDPKHGGNVARINVLDVTKDHDLSLRLGEAR